MRSVSVFSLLYWGAALIPRKKKKGATVGRAQSVKVTAESLTVIGECEDREGLGLAATAGDLHSPLAGEWVTVTFSVWKRTIGSR